MISFIKLATTRSTTLAVSPASTVNGACHPRRCTSSTKIVASSARTAVSQVRGTRNVLFTEFAFHTHMHNAQLCIHLSASNIHKAALVNENSLVCTMQKCLEQYKYVSYLQNLRGTFLITSANVRLFVRPLSGLRNKLLSDFHENLQDHRRLLWNIKFWCESFSNWPF